MTKEGYERYFSTYDKNVAYSIVTKDINYVKEEIKKQPPQGDIFFSVEEQSIN